ncbi:hypothetical protein [Tunicatimonas pelagia]|uniref:hypothetical protein n=1 Tax=Tunicatimonas pelagia TaxID=931531 RepID=UPI00266607DB|nr:hypothetical protein [Tunicatimonas pelagia]WKN42106.1 hypothetical protein P0M28_24010 [Tunicatimonas pelagia]
MKLLFQRILFAFTLAVLGGITACDDGLDVLPPEPPIIDILNGGTLVEKNVRDTLPLVLDIKIAASERLQSYELQQDGELLANASFTNEYTHTFQYTYSLDEDLEAGDELAFSLIVTDQQGQTTEQDITLRILNRLFFVGNTTIAGQPLRTLEGIIDTAFTLSADTSWLVKGYLEVRAGGTLAIEAGTTVYMETYDDIGESSSIKVLRDGKIEATGTKEAPVVFTSDRVLTGNAQVGDWGTITLQGRSPVNTGEGGVVLENGPFGGQNPDHSTGTLRYVRIEYTGKIGSDGLRLQGVGRGTLLEYIQIYQCTGEGLKINGGTADIRYFVGTAIYDDGMEWENGYLGRGQFWVFECDTERQGEISFYGKNSQRRNPVSNPVFSNVTILGPGENAEFESNGNAVSFNNRGLRMTNGTHGKLYNFIVTQFNDDGVRVEQAFDAGDIDGLDGNLVIAHSSSFNNKDNYDIDGKYFIYDPADAGSDPAYAVFNNSLAAVPEVTVGNFVGSTREGALNPTTLGDWFLPAPYVGAVENAANDWTADGNWCKNLDGSLR